VVLIEKGRPVRGLWLLVFSVSLLPLLLLVFDVIEGRLGADPAKEIVQNLGVWAAIFLWLSLFVSPMRRRLKVRWLIHFRRMLGLYSFFYLVLHFIAFSVFILGLRLDLLVMEISKRPYIVVGMVALVLMVPLVVTSTKNAQKRLGKKWLELHRLVYLIAALVMVHIVWMVRASYLDAVLYGAFLVMAFLERLWFKYERPG
jgi:sulfoxide reductase heme-binding subunit YedZ